MVRSSGPVQSGMPARRALVDALRQRAHARDALGDLLPQQHSAAAGFGALAEHDLDGVGLAQVVGVHPVARRQVLVHQVLALAALLGRHAAVAGGGRRADRAGAAAQRLLGRARTAHRRTCRRWSPECPGAEDVWRAGRRARRRCRSVRGSPPAGSATSTRRGTAGRRSGAAAAWRPSRGCRRCRSRRPAGSPRWSAGRRWRTRAGPAGAVVGVCHQ